MVHGDAFWGRGGGGGGGGCTGGGVGEDEGEWQYWFLDSLSLELVRFMTMSVS